MIHMTVPFFFLNDTATTEIYTLSLHDALPICRPAGPRRPCPCRGRTRRGRWRGGTCGASAAGSSGGRRGWRRPPGPGRSEEHTSELQSRLHLVCRLLLEKKKKIINDRLQS